MSAQFTDPLRKYLHAHNVHSLLRDLYSSVLRTKTEDPQRMIIDILEHRITPSRDPLPSYFRQDFERLFMGDIDDIKFRAVQSIRILSYLSPVIRAELAAQFVEQTFAPGEKIIQDNIPVDNPQFFIIKSGTVDIYQPVPDGVFHRGYASVFEYFGEHMMTYHPSEIYVVARDEVTCWALSLPAFKKWVEPIMMSKRTQVMPSLNSIALFAELTNFELALFADSCLYIPCEIGYTPVEEGDAGDGFYVILRGSAIVTRKNKEIGRLVEGDFFGELAILNDQPRFATVTMTSSSSVVLFFEKNLFRHLMDRTNSEHLVNQQIKHYNESRTDLI
ncbi:hypothetical protein RCL1_004852 [Eukaryota sp. TZLM3-RCL]